LDKQDIDDGQYKINKETVQEELLRLPARDYLAEEIELKGNDDQRFDIIQEDIVDVVECHVGTDRFQRKIHEKEHGEVFQILLPAG
jgi:hypothetical protein